ncbi:hypothetical protein PQX77_020659 [Marasmius sp. AFHP31]|nr:hypothetical protein PQX77_020659 [Marasmius sp. AFHP31]
MGEDWLFNVKSLTWQYDPASVLLNPPSERDLAPFHDPLTPLRQETLPRLDTAEIVACVERSFGDVLHLLALYGTGWCCDLSNFAQHRLLTFGAVFSYKRGILAYLPSIPSPERYCKSRSPNLKASYSSSVPAWRVDLTFCKTGHTQVTLYFGWCMPEKHRNQLRCAYLCQSLSFYSNSDDVRHVFFIDEIGFSLEGAFPDDLTTRLKPLYLFIPPLPSDIINNTHRIRYPLPKNLFYWSHDPQGRTAVVEEDWEKFGIPKLRVQGWFGSSWEKHLYAYVQHHLRSGGYELDGKQYARDHGYPELIHANPHATVGLKDPKISPSQLASPSTSPLDFLHLIASFGGRLEGSLSKFALHGILTFGTVVDYRDHKILAYLSSSPSPEWFCQSLTPDVKAICSSSVPWRVDLLYHKAGNMRVILELGLRIPEDVRNQFGAAYLCRSLPFCDVSDDASHVVYVDQVGFRLKGTFLEEPAQCAPPAYLFVPPLRTKLINDMCCVPFPKSVFYWSHDPQGRDAIAEEDWATFGIPELTVEEWIGCSWEEEDYTAVWEHLDSLNLDLDGRDYAHKHIYPELIRGDPHAIEDGIHSDSELRYPSSPSHSQPTSPLHADLHDTAMTEGIMYSDSAREVSRSPLPLPFPSTSSLAEASSKCDTDHENTPAQSETHWAKPIFIKWYNSVLKTLAEGDALDHSVVAC